MNSRDEPNYPSRYGAAAGRPPLPLVTWPVRPDRRGPRWTLRAELGAWPWRAGGHSGTSGPWVDVVVEPEDIVWIVASFDRDEPSVVGSPDLVHLLPVLGGQVVDIAPVGHVGAECLERLFGPGD